MSEIETYEFSLPADLSAPLGRHAIDMARLEVTRLLLFHEFPSVLEIDFQKAPTPQETLQASKKQQLYMPADLEPSFTCVRTPEETYELAALLPFSIKMRQFIGACGIGLTLEFPHKERSMMGRPELHWLTRIFDIDESTTETRVRHLQKTPAVTLRDFSDSLNNLRKGVPSKAIAIAGLVQSRPPPGITLL